LDSGNKSKGFLAALGTTSTTTSAFFSTFFSTFLLSFLGAASFLSALA